MLSQFVLTLIEHHANKANIADEIILSKIFFVRGQKVMLDQDLAELYKKETKHLKRHVRTYIERYPCEDFMFELSPGEYQISRSQIGTLKKGQNFKNAPITFTGLGELFIEACTKKQLKNNRNFKL